ncbi:MAG TPA: DUF4157 domain-containing protein, partial [Kofleriaceae bacterium]|nr:DUF4157 domain-containing protein [Kofleriaceae bacterium]
RFRWDFGRVRLHTDPVASASARALGALGYAVGQHVVLGEGSHAPDTERGRHVLAHELAHTIQQSRAREPIAVADLAITPAHDASETAAELAAEAALMGRHVRGLGPLGSALQLQRLLDLRTLVPHFAKDECALLVTVANTDMAGPPDAPPGRFNEVWAEYCIPKPRVDDPERGHILPRDEAFGPFQKGSYIRVQRFAEIELDGGIKIQFTIRGFQRTKDDFTKLPTSASELQALLEAEGTSMFELDIEANVSSPTPQNVSIVGSFEYAKKQAGPTPGLHPLMRNVGAPEWAAVLIDNPTQYRSILARLLAAAPYLNRFTVPLTQAPGSKTFDTQAEAETAAGSSSSPFVAGTVITKGKDSKYHLYYLQPMDLFWTSERARRPGKNAGMPPRYAFLDDGFLGLYVSGRKIDKLSAFADAYYLDADAAQRGAGGAQDALVYKTPDGFFGRYALKRSDALDWWKKLDTFSPDRLRNETVRHWRGYDLGKLHCLYVRGQGSFHVIDAGYLEARDRYKKDRKTLSADRVEVGKKDYDPMSWFVLAETGHEDNFRYLEGELDRPTAAGGGTLLAQIEGSDPLVLGVAHFALDRVSDRCRKEAKAIVKRMQSLVAQLGTSETDLKRILLAYPRLDAETRKAIVQMMGVEEKDQDATIKTLSNMSSALDIYRGLEVGGVSIARLTRSIAKTRTELSDLITGLDSGKIQAVAFEGDFGTIVRERAYRSLGFSKLKGEEYPHHDSRGLMPDYLAGNAADSANLLERVYGNYVATQATAGTIVKVAVVTGLAVLTALLILLSGGLAALIAEAFFEGSVAAEIVIGAAIFTGVSEGLAQAMGAGALNSKDWDFGLTKLGLSFVINVITFGIFRGLNTIIKGWTLAARLGVTFTSFLVVSIGAHMLSHKGKLPKGAEWGWLLYETVLMFALLEAGGYFGRDAFMKMQIAGRNIRAGNLATRLDGIRADADKLRLDYNAAFDSSTRAEKIALADRYAKTLEQHEALLTELASLKGIDVNVDIASELRLVKQQKQAVAEATFLLKSGLRQLGAGPEVFTYSAGKEGAEAIKTRFGADKVSGPDGDEVITVADGGRTLLFLPERAGAGARPNTKAFAARSGVRTLADGVFAVEPRVLDAVKTDITGAGGKVTELRPGHYSATVGGESFVVVSEKEARIASLAKEAEGKQPGAGRVVVVQSMRSDLAREGLQARLQGEWKDLGEGRLLDQVKALEDAAVTGGRSLNDVLEGEALAARTKKTGEAFGATGQPRTDHIATSDAHIQALRDEIAFLKSLEDAHLSTAAARTALETRLAAAIAARGDLVLNQAALSGSATLHTYQPGPEAKTLLEARYGKGKVSDPDANRMIRVDIGGVTHIFVPAPEGAAPGAATANVSQDGQGRVLAPGVVAVEPKAMRGAERRIPAQGGTWTDAGNGMAVVTLNGETIVVISEGALRLVPIGLAAEAASPGSGLAALRAQLRSELAKKGLDAWVDANRAGRSDADVLTDLEKLETAEASKKRDPQSLHAVLEAQAVAAAQAKAQAKALAELVQFIKDTGFVNDPWVQDMIKKGNSDEIRGVLAEMRVHQLKTAEIAANPSFAGRNVRVIDKVWVLAKQPEASIPAWEVTHPRPERSAFPDDASFETAQKAWGGKKGSIKDLPGGGIAEQVKDIDHVVVEDTGGKLKVLSTAETKYRPLPRQQTEAGEARDALVEAITHGTARGTTAVVARAEGNVIAEILTGKLEVTGTPPAEATTPDVDVDALAKDIVNKKGAGYKP